MAKIQIKSEKLTPFGGIFSIMENLTHAFTRYRLNTGSDAAVSSDISSAR